VDAISRSVGFFTHDLGLVGVVLAYLAAAVVFVLSSVLCIVVYGWLSPRLITRLDGSTTARAMFFFLVQIVGNLVGAAMIDAISITGAINGKLNLIQAVLLSAFSLVFPPWATLTLVGFRRGERLEEQLEKTKEDHKNNVLSLETGLKTSECQNNFLGALLLGIRETVGAYSRRILDCVPCDGKKTVKSTEQAQPRMMIGLVVDACRFAFQAVVAREGGLCSLSAVLFRQGDDGYLVPEYSNNGATTGFFDAWYHLHRDLFATNGTSNFPASVALQSGIEIWPSVTSRHDDLSLPFRFPDTTYTNAMKSVIAIRLENTEYFKDVSGQVNHKTVRRVLMIFCDRDNAFQKSYRWKAEQVQLHISSRMDLFLLQQFVQEHGPFANDSQEIAKGSDGAIPHLRQPPEVQPSPAQSLISNDGEQSLPSA
jgi:hypothetical protein